MTLSTGNSAQPDKINQLLNTIRGLVCDSPPPVSPIQWFAVRWDFDESQFDITTLRQEPDIVSPIKDQHALTWPWVYIPAVPAIPAPQAGQNGYPPTAYAAVKWINQQCHGTSSRASELLALATGKIKANPIADIVRRVGGVVIRPTSTDQLATQPQPRKLYPLKQPPADREPINPRVRSQPQRYTRTKHRSNQLANLASHDRPVVKSGLRLAIQQARRKAPTPPVTSSPVPVPPRIDLSTGKSRTEDELREWLGLQTYADQIITALGLE